VAKPTIPQRAISVVTMDSVPGREIAQVVGAVVGVVARSRELSPDLRIGNPVDGYATMLTRSRQDAVTKVVDMAVAAGADAVVGLRFDCSEITQSLSEVAAYGTAVKLVAEPAAATPEGASSEAAGTPASTSQPADKPAGSSSDDPWPPSSWPSQS
jgi:uncharacterized protein YbjQ (UPF0145 family)